MLSKGGAPHPLCCAEVEDPAQLVGGVAAGHARRGSAVRWACAIIFWTTAGHLHRLWGDASMWRACNIGGAVVDAEGASLEPTSQVNRSTVTMGRSDWPARVGDAGSAYASSRSTYDNGAPQPRRGHLSTLREPLNKWLKLSMAGTFSRPLIPLQVHTMDPVMVRDNMVDCATLLFDAVEGWSFRYPPEPQLWLLAAAAVGMLPDNSQGLR